MQARQWSRKKKRDISKMAHQDPLIASNIKAYLDAQADKSFLRVIHLWLR